jgi:carboxypeptidase PM20D1
LTVAGTGGHASMPPPHTAIGTLSAAIQRLESNPMPAEIIEPVRQMFSCVGPEMTLTRRMILANLWLFEPLVKRQLAASPATNALLRTTAAVTMLQGGTKENVLPAEAKAIVNFRVLPGDTVASVTEHVRRVINDTTVTVKTLKAVEPSPVTPTDSETFRTLARTIRQVIPEVVVAPGLLVAGTDSKHYLSLADATYRFLPIRLTGEDLQRIHGANERIAIDNYAEVISFYTQLIQNSAS